jgi:3-dehydro-L-gulonate 2-dehydrogenase
MERTIALARQHGLGGVALANTNHWMRGGSYGWLAADAGLFAICWTNTLANLPAWGAATPTLGNNPLVIAVPRPGGAHVVLDMAMSQFSYGRFPPTAPAARNCPSPAATTLSGNLTTRPRRHRSLQARARHRLLEGFRTLAGPRHARRHALRRPRAHQIPQESTRESGVSQVFLAIDPSSFAARADLDRIAGGILASLRDATPIDPARPIRYPGEQTLHLRQENLRLGVPVKPRRLADS